MVLDRSPSIPIKQGGGYIMKKIDVNKAINLKRCLPSVKDFYDVMLWAKKRVTNISKDRGSFSICFKTCNVIKVLFFKFKKHIK